MRSGNTAPLFCLNRSHIYIYCSSSHWCRWKWLLTCPFDLNRQEVMFECLSYEETHAEMNHPSVLPQAPTTPCLSVSQATRPARGHCRRQPWSQCLRWANHSDTVASHTSFSSGPYHGCPHSCLGRNENRVQTFPRHDETGEGIDIHPGCLRTYSLQVSLTAPHVKDQLNGILDMSPSAHKRAMASWRVVRLRSIKWLLIWTISVFW